MKYLYVQRFPTDITQFNEMHSLFNFLTIDYDGSPT